MPSYTGFAARAAILRELAMFLRERRLWWLVPMVTVLLVFGVLLVLAHASAVGPFIYSLF